MTKSIAKVTIVLELLACIQVGLSATFEESKIVNGDTATLGEFPYQVSIQQNGAPICGGSIVNKNYVVTSAQCVSGIPSQNLSVIAGTINLDDLTGASIHNVSSVKVHELYNATDSWKNDIALLKVDPPFEFNTNIAAATLASKGETLENGKAAILSGFGNTDTVGTTSRILRKTNVFIRSNQQCQSRYSDATIYPTNVCSINTDKTTGFCKGDGGGPLSADGKVVGIISFSVNNGCQLENFPQVSTRVSEYVDWIGTNSA